MRRLRCVVLDDYQAIARSLAPWEQLADRVQVEFVHEHLSDRQALLARLWTAEIVVVNRERTSLDADIISALPDLRLIVTTGMRNAAVDGAAARERGIPVCGTGNAGGAAAELTWALLLAASRNIVVEAGAVSAGRWQQTVGLGLEGRTLGLVGVGTVGQRVARIGAAFGMHVLAWTPNLVKERAEALGVTAVESLRELFATSDFVSLHAPLSDASRGLVTRALFYAMKPEAVFINTARAALVDEEALIEVLKAGRIRGAALDVFMEEPLPSEHPLRTLPNVLATPHVGYVTDHNFRRYFGDAVEDIAAWIAGAPVRVIN